MMSKGSFACLSGASGLNKSLLCNSRRSPGPPVRGFASSVEEDDYIPRLKVNRDRLMADIHYTCQWGKGERWGQ